MEHIQVFNVVNCSTQLVNTCGQAMTHYVLKMAESISRKGSGEEERIDLY
jgi:hypothetical protein